MNTRSLKARWVFPVDQPPIAGGVVTLVGQKIAAVGRVGQMTSQLDLGNVALLPGLVNAHTHLEFSDLKAPVGQKGIPLPDWLRKILALRDLHRNAATAVVLGGQESVFRGTTLIGNIVSASETDYATLTASVDLTLFYEVIHFPNDRLDVAVQAIQKQLYNQKVSQSLTLGISPHAPYTVHPELVSRLARLAREMDVPLAMHLAESPEELAMMANGSGPFVQLLTERGLWQPEAIPVGTRPFDYLKRLQVGNRVLIIHGNYLDQEELRFLAANANRMSLVYCPRTHHYFCHSPYPLVNAYQLGVHVAIGTDSRASNPDLSVLEEMRYVARHHTALPPEQILRMGTIHGAEALGQGQLLGTLTAGKWAHLTAVKLTDDAASDPHELLLGGDGPVIGTWVRGRKIAPSGPR